MLGQLLKPDFGAESHSNKSAVEVVTIEPPAWLINAQALIEDGWCNAKMENVIDIPHPNEFGSRTGSER